MIGRRDEIMREKIGETMTEMIGGIMRGRREGITRRTIGKSMSEKEGRELTG